jgi:hypothetical protein
MSPAKEGFRMSELNEKLLEPLENLKDVQKMEFGYFRHLATMSTGSILILIAFLEKVFSFPQFKGWALASLGCFALCLLYSLMALQSANNLVLVPIGIRMIYATRNADEKEEVTKKKAKEVQKGLDKIQRALRLLGRYDKATICLFIAGFVALLMFAGINFYN